MQARVVLVAVTLLSSAVIGMTACTPRGPTLPRTTTPTESRVDTSGGIGSSPRTASGTPALLGGGSTTGLTGFCAKLVAAGLKLNAAQTALYDGGSPGALTTIINDLNDLEKGAPTDIQAALQDMQSAFQSAQQVMVRNVTPSSAEFAKVGPRLEKDDTLISDYTASKCASN